jgi:cold shock protein
VPTGRVKFYRDESWGFLTPDGGGRDVFVHRTEVEAAGLKTLRDNQRLSFDIAQDPRGKGPIATNLVDLDISKD